MSLPGGDLRSAVQRKASFLQTMRAVGWSFFGVRKSSDYEKDVSQLNPVHVAIAGVLGAVLFIAVLLVLVKLGAGQRRRRLRAWPRRVW